MNPTMTIGRTSSTARWQTGGFNLLPYRQQRRQRLRRRCLIEWFGAALAGSAAVIILAGWQLVERRGLANQREAHEQVIAQWRNSLAEHAKLSKEIREQRENIARAAALSRPLAHLLDLLDALSDQGGNGVVLKQIRQRIHQTELLATSADALAPADWLDYLAGVRDVLGVEFSDLRGARRGEGKAPASSRTPLEFAARLRWNDAGDALEKALHPVAPAIRPNPGDGLRDRS
jgi:Tfp pilus assembly protein PilN